MSDNTDDLSLEITDDSALGQGGQGELILGKFKTQEDLIESYSAAQSELTRKSQELADTKRSLEALQTQQPQQIQQQAGEEEDIEQLFFREPVKVLKKEVGQAVAPIFEFIYNQQKEPFRSDPEFVKYEQDVDKIINMQPGLKTQPGIVAQVFKMVKGLHFDSDEFEKQVIEKYKKTSQRKIEGSLEGATQSDDLSQGKDLPDLSAEEKRVALSFYPGASREEAFKKYAVQKAKVGGDR